MNEIDQIFQINTHLLYELKWMVYAGARLEENREDEPTVALVDSAAIHARNLFEFAEKPKKENHFTLTMLEGTAQKAGGWTRWANNRVAHMMLREHDQAPWPDGLDNQRVDRLTKMAEAVLDRLEAGGKDIPLGPVRDAYWELLERARACWRDPSPANARLVDDLYDNSRDDRDYQANAK